MKTKAALIRVVFQSSVAALVLSGAALWGQDLLVANSGSATVSELNSFARSLVKTFTVSVGAPVGVAINPSSTLGASLDVLRPNSGPIVVDFYDLSASSSSTTPSGSSVTLSGLWPGTFGPDIAFSDDGACVVVAHGPNTGGRVSSVSVASRTEVTLLTGTGQRTIATVPNHPTLVLSSFAFIMDILTLGGGCTLTNASSLAIPGASVIQKIAVFPNGQGALLADGAGMVHVLSISGAGAVSYVKTIAIGDTPQSIAITPDGHHAYAYKAGAGKLRLLFIDPFGNVTDSGLEVTVPATVIPGSSGFNFVATDGNTVYVTGVTGVSTTLTMVDVPTFTVVGTVTVGTAPVSLAYGGCPHHTVHGHIDTVPPGHHNGVVAGIHHGQHGHLVPAGVSCPPHAPGHSPGLMGETDGEGLFSTSSLLRPPAFVAGVNQDGTLNGNPATVTGAKVLPAHRGTVVQLFGSAASFFLDPQDLRAASSFTPPASGSPLFYTTSLPEVRVGGIAAQVLFSGLAPGLTGVWQVNVRVPDGVSAGNAPVTINYEGDELTSVSLAIE